MNTEKIEKLKKSLSNSKIPADLKPKIEAEIKRLEDLDAKNSPQPKEEEKPVAKKTTNRKPRATKSVAKKTSIAKPSQTSKPKRTAMSVAKEIRKDGESWKDAMARASKVMKEKTHTATKDVESELDKLTKFVKGKKELQGQIGQTNLLRDAKRKAKPMGRRVSKDGNVYYENRANRTDRGTFGKYHLAKGGEIEFQHSNLRIIGTGMDSNGNRVVKVSFPNERPFSIQTNGNLPKTHNLLKGYDKNTNFSAKEIESMEDEIVDYVENNGSANQKKSLKVSGSWLDKDNYANGGGIPNNYEDKTPEEVWNMWTPDQREHFLADHYDVMDGKDLGAKNKSFKSLNFLTQTQLELHIKQGQYATGGSINEKTTKMRKQRLKKGDNVFVIGRRWFDRVNGNTYHTAEVEVNGEFVGKSRMTYGYDDQYLETAKEILLQHYDFPRGMTERSPMWQLRDYGVTLNKTVSDGLKRDLAKGGGVRRINGRDYDFGSAWTNDHNQYDKGSDHEVEYRRKKKFEIGGTVVTDLAGHTGGSLGGDPTMLDGMSGTSYTGLVGETGAMSSGEMFENGGGVDGKEVIKLKVYGYSGNVIREGDFLINYNDSTITFPSGKTFKVVEDREYTIKMQKTQIKANRGIKGLADFLKEINTPETPFKGMGMNLIDLGKDGKYELGGGLPSGVNQSYMITEAFGNPAQHLAKGGGFSEHNGRKYDIGRNWTKDHNEFDKGSDHEVEYRRKKSFFAKGGAMENIEYDDVLEVLKEKLEGAIDDLPMDFENSDSFTGEEVEKESRDGFIAYTDGGYEVNWFEYMTMFNGSGKSLPTKPLDDEMQRQIDYNYQYAKERFIEEYPEIVEELGEDNIDYSSLYDADYGDEAEQLSEWEMDSEDDSILCEIGAYYYDTDNSRGIDEKHTIRLFGYVNLESPYHRRGNLDDSYDIDITFDSISELKEKVDAGLKEIIDWFDGKYYNDSTTEMKIRRMADGGEFMTDPTFGNFQNQVFDKGGKVSPFKNIMETNTITEKEINLIKLRMNNDKVDEDTQEVIDYIWDNSPQLTPDQNKKGIDFLRNLWKSPTGKERTNNPFGYREQDALETFEYFELRGFYDAGNRYNKFYVPLYTCVGADSSFEYAFYGGKVNILG